MMAVLNYNEAQIQRRKQNIHWDLLTIKAYVKGYRHQSQHPSCSIKGQLSGPARTRVECLSHPIKGHWATWCQNWKEVQVTKTITELWLLRNSTLKLSHLLAPSAGWALSGHNNHTSLHFPFVINGYTTWLQVSDLKTRVTYYLIDFLLEQLTRVILRRRQSGCRPALKSSAGFLGGTRLPRRPVCVVESGCWLGKKASLLHHMDLSIGLVIQYLASLVVSDSRARWKPQFPSR